MPDAKEITVTGIALAGQRLDVALASLSGQSRSMVERLIQTGCATVDGKPALKPGMKLKADQALALTLPPPEPLRLEPEPMALQILFEDADLAVVVKPRGLVVHPAAGHSTGTLVHGLLAQLEGLSGIGGAMRPGIVHRLDKDTSGLMLVAKTDRAHQGLSSQIAARDVRKTYLAAVQGAFSEPTGTIEAPIARHPTDRKRMAVVEGGKPATTLYRLRTPLRGASLLEVDLITGRTHQIRVHMAWKGHPLLGDVLYGNKQAAAPCLMLHAWKLAFVHPVTGAPLALEVPPPEDFVRAVRKLELES